MTANNRIFYATQTVQLQPQNRDGSSLYNGWLTPLGVQSAGMTTNFNLEQVFTLGQLELYDNVENVPEIQVTMNKIIDGTVPLYLICMGGVDLDGSGENIVALANNRVNFRLGIYADTNAVASGVPSFLVNSSGMYLSNFSYTFPVEGNATEDVTLVGNYKKWQDPNETDLNTGFDPDIARNSLQTVRRYNLNYTNCVLPTGTGGIRVPEGRTGDRPYLQSVKVSADLGREAIYELGRMAPYYRYVKFPLEVTSEFEIIASDGDQVDADDFHEVEGCGNSYKNVVPKQITVSVCGSGGEDSLTLELGDKNRLTSVNYTGGDTGGGNASITYSFQTFNHFVLTASGTFNDYTVIGD